MIIDYLNKCNKFFRKKQIRINFFVILLVTETLVEYLLCCYYDWMIESLPSESFGSAYCPSTSPCFGFLNGSGRLFSFGTTETDSVSIAVPGTVPGSPRAAATRGAILCTDLGTNSESFLVKGCSYHEALCYDSFQLLYFFRKRELGSWL